MATQQHHLLPASEGVWSVHRFLVEASATELWIAGYLGDPGGPYAGLIWLDDFYLGEFPSGPARPK
jgi:hypothetical protein